MTPQPTDNDTASKGIGLLISILVRYPELATVNYDPQDRTMTFTVLVARSLEGEELEGLRRDLVLSGEALADLEGRELQRFCVNTSDFDGLTVLEVVRDVESLTQREISLHTATLGGRLGEALVCDSAGGNIVEEDLAVQEEMIGQMLDDLRGVRSNRRLVAVRESGRVMVFNK